MNETSRERERERSDETSQSHASWSRKQKTAVLLQFSGVSVYRVFAAHLGAYSAGKKNYFTSSPFGLSNVYCFITT